jgi:NAD(P)-dependent dehydrogenase (short-subunit alcohol dehydrogenase family)
MSGKFSVQKQFRLDGKTVVITGATGILGNYFCRGLAESGANLVLVDLDQKLLETLATDLADNFEIKTLPIACDISKPEEVDRLLKKSVEAFGKIDVLHNNAASKSENVRNFFEPTATFDMKAWRDIMSVNVDGLFLVGRAFGTHMAQNKRGSIIQTGSIYGIVAPDQRIYEGSNYLGGPISSPAVYSASKAAVVGLTKYFASLWGQHGVRVNTLIPGGVESGQNETFKANYSRRVPLGRMATAEEMVGPLVFLASDASSYISGQEIIVDGGLTAW